MDEGRKQGREQGRKQADAEWEAWLKRLKEAGYGDLPTDIPPPSRRNGDSG